MNLVYFYLFLFLKKDPLRTFWTFKEKQTFLVITSSNKRGLVNQSNCLISPNKISKIAITFDGVQGIFQNFLLFFHETVFRFFKIQLEGKYKGQTIVKSYQDVNKVEESDSKTRKINVYAIFNILNTQNKTYICKEKDLAVIPSKKLLIQYGKT